MEEHTNNVIENTPQQSAEGQNTLPNKAGNQGQIAGAIIIAGILIAGAILLKGNTTTVAPQLGENVAATIAPVTEKDQRLGNPNAKVTLVLYEDFQCPFCAKFAKESEELIRNTYVADGRVQFVYRDLAFLGPESQRAAEASRCAADQGKFWEYHDYIFTHQNGENQGALSDTNLKSFAVKIGLNTSTFNQCMDTEKYAQTIKDDTAAAGAAGVRGTPKGFILKNGKVVDTIDGAIPVASVTAKLDAALK
ncbi:MAG: DsbA family protein [Candidatus Pacebacteria bacterium]|nr:DsbA family protein [Candidatus Paceibacterota bacterium]